MSFVDTTAVLSFVKLNALIWSCLSSGGQDGMVEERCEGGA